MDDRKTIATTRRDVLIGGCAAAAAAVTPAWALAQTADETRALVPVREGVWRTQEEGFFGLLVETVDGMIVFDPINRGFADWLNAEIARRFNKPVKYLIYSHNHWDHVTGGQAFDAHDPVTVCHELARKSIVRMQLDTRLPGQTFAQGFDIELGGRRVELRYLGQSDGQGSITLRVPDQGVLSAVDWLVIGRLPYKYLYRYNVDGTIASLRAVEDMDWEIAAPGHAGMGGKDDVRVTRRYYEAVCDGVVEGLVAKRSADEVVKSLRPQLAANSDFAALKEFDAWVDMNIRGIYEQIAKVEGLVNEDD